MVGGGGHRACVGGWVAGGGLGDVYLCELPTCVCVFVCACVWVGG